MGNYNIKPNLQITFGADCYNAFIALDRAANELKHTYFFIQCTGIPYLFLIE